jgi:hypothetical protein
MLRWGALLGEQGMIGDGRGVLHVKELLDV